jgi:hypothetical protein
MLGRHPHITVMKLHRQLDSSVFAIERRNTARNNECLRVSGNSRASLCVYAMDDTCCSQRSMNGLRVYSLARLDLDIHDGSHAVIGDADDNRHMLAAIILAD